jgi:MFS family permease
LALLTASFPESPQRARAVAAYAAVAGIGASLGLVVGGVLAEVVSWRAGFFLNVPIGLAMLNAQTYSIEAANARSLLTVRGRAGRDATGGVALAVALAALVAEIAAWQAVRGRDHQAAAARGPRRTPPSGPPACRTGGPGAALGRGIGRARSTPRLHGGSGGPAPAEQRVHHDTTERDLSTSFPSFTGVVEACRRRRVRR